MKTKHYLLIAGGLVLGLMVQNATAAEKGHPARPTEAQMQAVKACAEAKGVTMPTPPMGKPGERMAKGKLTDGERPDGQHMNGQGPEGQRPDGPPPAGKLSKEQRSVLDQCFKEAGLKPPKGPLGDKHGDRQAPPPEK
jgi:hypothetical protein